jgi:predicted adenine nucleotide alpha hydrolase (AANH) superfamily ATPase
MKVLLHTCCAPCLIYPFRKLQEGNHEVTSFFYNPNVQPYLEYRERLCCVYEYCVNNRIDLIDNKYDPVVHLRQVVFHEAEPERCEICYRLRLDETAKVAKERGFDCFTTTLLVSPHQKHELLKEIGDEAGKKFQISFFCEDFRVGYREGVDKSRELGMYRQKYCGCIFSERERFQPESRTQSSEHRAQNTGPRAQTTEQ